MEYNVVRKRIRRERTNEKDRDDIGVIKKQDKSLYLVYNVEWSTNVSTLKKWMRTHSLNMGSSAIFLHTGSDSSIRFTVVFPDNTDEESKQCILQTEYDWYIHNEATRRAGGCNMET
jgi:hypothetical protein